MPRILVVSSEVRIIGAIDRVAVGIWVSINNQRRRIIDMIIPRMTSLNIRGSNSMMNIFVNGYWIG